MSRPVPKSKEIMWPILQVLQEKGGPASRSEIYNAVIEKMNLPDEVRRRPHENSNKDYFETRLWFALSWLKNTANAVDDVNPGVWVLTPDGVDLLKGTEDKMHKQLMELSKKKNKQSTASKGGTEAEEQGGDDWKADLLDRLREIDPYKFEELCGDLLRAQDFTDVKVTQRSHDGGIDGTASMWVNDLISSDIAFQCKRHKGNVGSKDMDAFLGALTKFGTRRGLFITTGRYTENAKKAAKNNPMYKVNLIDGNMLCSLLKNHGMGVKMQEVIDESFFAKLRKKS